MYHRSSTTLILLLWFASQPCALHGFAPKLSVETRSSAPSEWRLYATQVADQVEVGSLLSDLPTPSLLIEMSLAESASGDVPLDDALLNVLESEDTFDGALFVHTQVTDTSERDEIAEMEGSGKSTTICLVDMPPDSLPSDAYLGIGLANHHVGGYYWARGMGMGASLPAHGIDFGSSPTEGRGRLFWRKRGPGMNAKETTEESSNSNDGKRSEWADFLSVGDTVQLVPNDTSRVLRESPFDVLLGVRRIGRPLGADPIVERIWYRSRDNGGVVWKVK